MMSIQILDDVKGRWRTTPNCGTKMASICAIGFDVPVKTVTTPQRKYVEVNYAITPPVNIIIPYVCV